MSDATINPNTHYLYVKEGTVHSRKKSEGAFGRFMDSIQNWFVRGSDFKLSSVAATLKENRSFYQINSQPLKSFQSTHARGLNGYKGRDYSAVFAGLTDSPVQSHPSRRSRETVRRQSAAKMGTSTRTASRSGKGKASKSHSVDSSPVDQTHKKSGQPARRGSDPTAASSSVGTEKRTTQDLNISLLEQSRKLAPSQLGIEFENPYTFAVYLFGNEAEAMSVLGGDRPVTQKEVAERLADRAVLEERLGHLDSIRAQLGLGELLRGDWFALVEKVYGDDWGKVLDGQIQVNTADFEKRLSAARDRQDPIGAMLRKAQQLAK